MPAGTYSPVRSGHTRVFLIDGRARPDHAPEFESCLRLTGISQGFGDVETIECPDPNNYGQFIEIGTFRGATERATTTLEGRYASELRSALLTLARKGCAIDVQLHIGECSDPSSFNTFTKALVLENALISTYGTDDLGALESGDQAAVNETADISAVDVYEILPLAVSEKANTLITNEILDVVIADTPSCGECEDESDGCNRIFAITAAAGGSPGTPADVVFSIDGGVTWYAHDIDSLGAAEAPNEVDFLGDYIVVVSNASASLHYALRSEFDGVTDPTFTEVTTGFVGGGEPNAIDAVSGFAFIVGDGGYVYGTEDATAGVSVLDAGSATSENLQAVHALNSNIAVAVGDNGAVIYTLTQGSWTASPTSPVGGGTTLYAVWVMSERVWWVGGSDGNLYYTLNAGVSWSTKAFPGSGSGIVYDIFFATGSVGYLAHQTAATAGRILRTYNGGYSWFALPESGTLQANDRINKVVACEHDANLVVGGGLADDASDGILLLGEA